MPNANCLIKFSPHYRRDAFEQGLKRTGYALTTSMVPTSRNDVMVVWNRMRGSQEQACEAWERQGGAVIVAENGYLQKGHGLTYAMSLGHHNGAGWFPVGDEDRFGRLGFEVKPWRVKGSEIVVCAQRGIGSKMMASPSGWAEHVASRLRTFTKYPVRVRHHPGLRTTTLDLVKDLANAAACVIWSSGAGVRALVEGVPVIYGAPRWICSEAATTLDFLHAPILSDPGEARATALHRMAWGQWSPEEIAAGTPFDLLKERRK